MQQAKKFIPETILKNKSGRIKTLYKKEIAVAHVHTIYDKVFALAFLSWYKSLIVGQYHTNAIIPTAKYDILRKCSSNSFIMQNLLKNLISQNKYNY